MENQPITHSTFVIERTYAASPERVFAAFADPAQKRRWFAEARGLTVDAFEMDFRVGGADRTQYRLGEDTPFPGAPLTNNTTYQDIVPNSRIIFAYTMSIGDHRISASLATTEFVPDGKGTKLIFTDQGAYFPNADGPAMRKDGWTTILNGLAKELER